MTYVSRRTDRKHQTIAKDQLRGKEAFAVLMGMRCVDGSTEYLSPTGWRRLDSYDGGMAAEFRLDGTGAFVRPTDHVKVPVDKFWHFKSSGGVDQVLSNSHRVLACGPRSATWGRVVAEVPEGFRTNPHRKTELFIETSPEELENEHATNGRQPAWSQIQTFIGYTATAFNLSTSNSGLDLTESDLRLMVAFHADGTIGYKPIRRATTWYGYIRVKRPRKKERLRALLKSAGRAYVESPAKPEGFSVFKFVPPMMTKSYGAEWWSASDAQRKMITDEVCHWDGGTNPDRGDARRYSSRHECDVDFIQYCFASTGYRTSKTYHPARARSRGLCSACHALSIVGHGRTNNLAMMPRPKPYDGEHDGFMYSLSVPSTYLLLRRNGKVFVTGNCGKSKVITDDWGEAVDAGTCVDLLMIAPGGAYKPWREALLADLPADIAARTKILVWDSGRAKTRAARWELEDFVAHRGPRALVVNVEALSSVKAARELCLDFLRQRPGANEVVIDEAVTIKNPDSLCGKFVINELRPLASRRRIMTGLVSPRSPLDLFNQFYFLDPKILGHATYATFKARYCTVKQVCMLPEAKLRGIFRARLGLGGYLTHAELQVRAKIFDPDLNAAPMSQVALREYVETMAEVCSRDRIPDVVKSLGGYVQTVPIVESYDHVEELHDKIAPHSYRVRLDQCYDMPPSDYSFRDVDWHPEQRRIYEELRQNATAELAAMEHVTATHVVVRMMRLHQVLCGHSVADDTREVRDVPERRTAALIQLLEDYDGKAVIWCSYGHSVRRVSEALERAFGAGSVARFWGGNIGTREAEEVRFKTDPACRFQIGTPDAGGRGRDWSVADLCVYFSCKNNLDHRQQSEERLKADGKTRPIAYVDMRVPDTVEAPIIRCLREKIDMAAVINGDEWRSWLI